MCERVLATSFNLGFNADNLGCAVQCSPDGPRTMSAADLKNMGMSQWDAFK
jgi:hypothetical protein